MNELMQVLPMIVIFGLIFYFLVYRPQAKRNKAQAALMASLAKGDEVLISGGIMGRIVKLTDDSVVLALSDTVEITVRRDFILATLPKGSVQTFKK